MKPTQKMFIRLLSLGATAALAQITALAQATTAPAQTNAPPPAAAAAPAAATAAPAQPATTAQATAPAPAPTQPPPPTTAKEDEALPRFRKGEMDLSPFAAYIDKAGGKWGAGAALTYYLNEKIGLGAATYWTEAGGTFFDNAEAEGYFRLPFLKVLAPYAVGSVGYQFDRRYWFETVGGGIDFRPFKRINAFSDLSYRISNETDKSKSGAFLRIGARFSF